MDLCSFKKIVQLKQLAQLDNLCHLCAVLYAFKHIQIVKIKVVNDFSESLVHDTFLEVNNNLIVFRRQSILFFFQQFEEVRWLVSNHTYVSIYANGWAHSLLFSPIVVTLANGIFAVIAFSILIFRLLRAWFVLIHLFIRTALTAHRLINFVRTASSTRWVSVLNTSCLVEPFKNEIGEFALHETQVHIFENTWGLRFDDANVVDTSGWNPYYLFVHQWLY